MTEGSTFSLLPEALSGRYHRLLGGMLRSEMIIFVSEDISNSSLQFKLQPRVTKFPKSSTPRTPSFNATTQLRELQQLALTTHNSNTEHLPDIYHAYRVLVFLSQPLSVIET
jgi:hypothetical protein